jgi:hypothetical protein
MPLALTVALLVVGGTALAGLVGYLIDRSAEPEEDADARSGRLSELDRRMKVTKNS